MTHPPTRAEYDRRFAANQRLEGYGIGNVTQHMPCPFCAAPDFMVHHILDVEEVMSLGATCQECGRSLKAIFTRSEGTVHFELVQTGGDDAPDYLPVIRRLT
jgi:hypothetical protein